MPGMKMKPSVFDGIPDKDEMERHYAAMRGGDNQMSYTESGDLVIPPEVQQANPGLVLAAMQTMQAMGANPMQYVSGSPEGSYNPDTGVQEFAWYDDLLKTAGEYTTKGLNYLSNSDVGKSLATAALTAGASKLAGADTKASLAAGAGAGLGYYAGDKLSTGISNLSNNKSFFDPKVQTNYNAQSVGEALKNVGKSINYSALSAAATGGLAGLAAFSSPPPMPNLQLDSPNSKPLDLKPLATSPMNKDFKENEQANLSATLPQSLPIAPLTPQALQSVGGVSYKKKVKDRDTGRFKYVDADDSNDASAFSRSLSKANRRRGFGGAIFTV